MSEMPFLFCKGKAVSYSELLCYVGNAKTCKCVLSAKDVKQFFFELVCALAYGKDICLVDFDATQSELFALGIEDAEKAQAICETKKIDSPLALLECVKNSTSKITLFTSGTTGLPKKVIHTVKTLSRAVRISEKYAKHVWGFAYNPTHIAGLQVFLQAIFNLNEIVFLFGEMPDKIFSLIDSKKITHISATPTFYRMLLGKDSVFKSVLRITCGGEKSDNILYAKLAKLFPCAKINNIYAATEFGTLLVCSGEYFSIPNSLSDKIKVQNNSLFVHKSLMGISDSLPDFGEWYKTGDLVEFVDTEKTKFRFIARQCNLVNTGGYKVNIEEVEDVLRQMPQVADAAVYGQKNSVIGNILCADIKPAKNAELEIPQIRQFLAARLQPFKIPRKITFVESLKQTATGKLKR